MGLVVVIVLLSASSWLLFVTFRNLSFHHAGIAWWLLLCGLVVFGAVVGYHLAFDFEYNASPQLRVVSFPIPICVFHFEQGQWVDYPSHELFAYPAAFTNVVVITALAVLPLLMASMLLHHRNGRETAEAAAR